MLMVKMFGLLNVWKPPGPTSYDVIRHIRRCVGRGVKVGHAGTLDPLAEGILVVCLGQATKLVGLIQSRPKQYATLARLGATSTTDDAEGEIQETGPAEPPAAEQVEQVIRRFVGVFEQVPPAYSAAKVAGRRAYKIARSGKRPNPAPKEVTVHSLEIIDYEYPHLRLRISCGSGTYIRSLVRDIGSELGVGGYCERIVRESVGPFCADEAVRMDQINADNIEQFLIRPVEAVPPDARITVTDAQARDLSQGRPIESSKGGPSAQPTLLLGAVNSHGDLVGLLRPDAAAGQLRPVKTFIAAGD